MLMTHFIWQTVLKPLSVYECQERSNHPFSHSYNAGKVLQCRQVGAGNMGRYNQFIEASRSSLGVVLGDLVDVAAWGIVPCVSKIDTLGGGGGGVRGGGGGRGCVVGDNT